MLKFNILVKTENPEHYSSFESLHTLIMSNSCSFQLVSIWHPGKGVKHGRCFSFTVVLDDSPVMLDHCLLHPSNLLPTGDFSICMDKPTETYSKQFISLLTAYGSNFKSSNQRESLTLPLLRTVLLTKRPYLQQWRSFSTGRVRQCSQATHQISNSPTASQDYLIGKVSQIRDNLQQKV